MQFVTLTHNNMKYFYLMIALLSSNFLSSQIMDSIKDRDTLYVIYNKKEAIEKFSLKKTQSKYEIVYSYKFPENKTIGFGVRLINNNNQSKSVIKKNELSNKNIFKNDDFLKINYENMVYILEMKKIKIFIIENYETNKRKLIKREVKMLNTVPIIM